MSKHDYLSQDWLVAQIAGALCESKQIVEEIVEEHQLDEVTVEDAENPSAIEIIARKQAFAQLSKEAKDLACLLFEAPDELLDLISYRNNPSQRRLWNYLRSLGWRGKVIKCVFEEFRTFVREHLT